MTHICAVVMKGYLNLLVVFFIIIIFVIIFGELIFILWKSYYDEATYECSMVRGFGEKCASDEECFGDRACDTNPVGPSTFTCSLVKGAECTSNYDCVNNLNCIKGSCGCSVFCFSLIYLFKRGKFFNVKSLFFYCQKLRISCVYWFLFKT